MAFLVAGFYFGCSQSSFRENPRRPSKRCTDTLREQCATLPSKFTASGWLTEQTHSQRSYARGLTVGSTTRMKNPTHRDFKSNWTKFSVTPTKILILFATSLTLP